MIKITTLFFSPPIISKYQRRFENEKRKKMNTTKGWRCRWKIFNKRDICINYKPILNYENAIELWKTSTILCCFFCVKTFSIDNRHFVTFPLH